VSACGRRLLEFNNLKGNTMSYEDLVTALKSLPADEQEQVAEFVMALKKHRQSANRLAKQNGAGLSRQPFIGMWRNREDLKDSRAWVRKVRRREWSDT